MVPDIIDLATLRDNGVRRESMFYAYFVFCQKFGTGCVAEESTKRFINVLAVFGRGCTCGWVCFGMDV
jgi:hypothetical protein